MRPLASRGLQQRNVIRTSDTRKKAPNVRPRMGPCGLSAVCVLGVLVKRPELRRGAAAVARRLNRARRPEAPARHQETPSAAPKGVQALP